MDTPQVATGGEVVMPAAAPATEQVALTVSSATKHLQEMRAQMEASPEPAKPDTPAAPAEAAAEPDQGTAPPQEANGDATATDEPAETPPIDPPRSWSKEWKEEFASYPRDVQEKIAQREQERDTAIRRTQNEAAEKAKALETRLSEADKARAQYEQALPALLQTLQTAQSGEFADVKTQEDVNKLATEDWPRFARYQAHLMQVAALEQEARKASERQTQEQKSRWQEFAAREDKALLDMAPELADPKVMERTSKAALKTLTDTGFSEDEIAKAWAGELGLSPRDHRFQALVLDATRYREAKANAAKTAPKPVPPVQRPGTTTSKGDGTLARVESISKRLSDAKGQDAVRLGVELMRLRREA